tara:strand:+ start:183 stop:674 length:492 start_codon:yes stop_codon:yes gene_type:complete
MSHTIKGIEDLTKTQATLYRSYVATNSKNTNQQKEITRLCELGTEGHREIEAIAELLKANAESTATIKVQVSRAMAKLQTGLTLQGLGKTDDDVVIAKKNTDNEPVESNKAPTPESQAEPDTKSFDFDELDKVFIAMATDQQKVMIAHLTKLMKATTKLRLAS